jgi:O-antigen ligase
MLSKVLKWSSIIVVLASVLFPIGAYFGAVAVFILAIKARKSRQILAELLEDKSVLIMLFSVLLSFIYSKDKLMSTAGAAMICLNVGLYLVLAVELKNIDLKKYYNILNIACLLACIYGIYQFASGNLKIEKSWVDVRNYGTIARVYSTLYNPNIFAAFLALNLSFAISRFESLREDILLSINIILSSICLLLTYSRGGFAAFAAAMLTLCLLKERKKGIVIYSAIMAAAFFIMNSAGQTNRAGLEAVYSDSSSLYRLEIWKAAWNMFLKSPIFGNGVGTTWYYLSEGSDKLYRYILHSHNIYLQVAAELGIVGVSAFISLLVSKVWEGCRLLKEKTIKEEAFIVQGFIACTAGIAVHGLIDAVIFVPAMSLIFAGYFALYSRVVSEYRGAVPDKIGMPVMQRLRIMQSLNGKSVLQLFGSESACDNEYKEEEEKAYQA